MARNGKVARLPLHTREEINRRLHDGQSGPTIINWVNNKESLKGKAQITPQNLSEWRKGGYNEWLNSYDKTQHIKRLSEHAFRLASAAGGDITAGGVAIAGGRILELLENACDDDMADLIDSISSLRKVEVASQKLELDRAQLETRQKALELEQRKFEWGTAKLFLKWFSNHKAKQIAESTRTTDRKISELVDLFFGPNPNDKN